MKTFLMFDKLVYLLNMLQSKEGYSVEQILEYMRNHMTLEEKLLLSQGYGRGMTKDMGDSVIVAVSMLPNMVP